VKYRTDDNGLRWPLPCKPSPEQKLHAEKEWAVVKAVGITAGVGMTIASGGAFALVLAPIIGVGWLVNKYKKPKLDIFGEPL
jgi:hypothetical protein